MGINGVPVVGLLDTGASVSVLGQNAMATVHRCGLKWKEFEGSAVKTTSGQPQKVVGFVDTDVTFKGKTRRIRLYIVPTLDQEWYLGVDFWLMFDLWPVLEEVGPVEMDPTATVDDDEEKADMHHFSEDQQQQLDEVIRLFPSSEEEGLGRTTLLRHTIDVGDARPTKQRYHAVSPAIEKKMYAEVDRMIGLGVVEESKSAWNSPVTAVAKANGQTRLCLDARLVNAVNVE